LFIKDSARKLICERRIVHSKFRRISDNSMGMPAVLIHSGIGV
jgi:hypothetical protein